MTEIITENGLKITVHRVEASADAWFEIENLGFSAYREEPLRVYVGGELMFDNTSHFKGSRSSSR